MCRSRAETATRDNRAMARIRSGEPRNQRAQFAYSSPDPRAGEVGRACAEGARLLADFLSPRAFPAHSPRSAGSPPQGDSSFTLAQLDGMPPTTAPLGVR